MYFSDRFDGSTLALFLFGYKTYTISVFFHFSVLPFHFELQVQFVRFVSCQCLPKFAEENSYVSLLPFTDDSVYHLSFLIYAREESHRAIDHGKLNYDRASVKYKSNQESRSTTKLFQL